MVKEGGIMNTAYLLLAVTAIVIVCVTGIALIGDYIREKDFEHKITGKKPCRKMKGHTVYFDSRMFEDQQFTKPSNPLCSGGRKVRP